jgi:hypothetical protein
MSCFIVPDFHVSALVSWAVAHGVDLDASPDAVAYVLASANRRAYSERYQGRHDSDVAQFGGLDRSAGAELQPVAIVKACDCLDYQASDWSRWNDSDAFGYLVAIRRAAVALAGPAGRASASGRALPGYDAAAWCLDEPDVAAEREPPPGAAGPPGRRGPGPCCLVRHLVRIRGDRPECCRLPGGGIFYRRPGRRPGNCRRDPGRPGHSCRHARLSCPVCPALARPVAGFFMPGSVPQAL